MLNDKVTNMLCKEHILRTLKITHHPKRQNPSSQKTNQKTPKIRYAERRAEDSKEISIRGKIKTSHKKRSRQL